MVRTNNLGILSTLSPRMSYAYPGTTDSYDEHPCRRPVAADITVRTQSLHGIHLRAAKVYRWLCRNQARLE